MALVISKPITSPKNQTKTLIKLEQSNNANHYPIIIRISVKNARKEQKIRVRTLRKFLLITPIHADN